MSGRRRGAASKGMHPWPWVNGWLPAESPAPALSRPAGGSGSVPTRIRQRVQAVDSGTAAAASERACFRYRDRLQRSGFHSDGALRELKRLPLHEIIVVENGSHDHTYAAARAFEGVTVIHIPERLGHDVARALGAKMSTGDIVLFMDGDMPVPAEKLSSYLVAADRGVDVALNDIMPFFAGIWPPR